MKRMLSLLAVLMLCTLMLAPAVAASPFMRYTQDYFGTVSMLCLYETEGAEETWEDVKALLREIDEAVSVSRETSDIARFNALASGESMQISDITRDILMTAKAAWELTDGLYDPTVFPLVDLWGFSPRFNRNTYRMELPYDRPLENGHPSPAGAADAAALLPLVGLDGVELKEEDGKWLLVKHTLPVEIGGCVIQAQMDPGGIAKGYACDRVAALLREKGYTEGYFVCGGSSMAFLTRPGDEMFSVTAGKPRGEDAGAYAGIRIRNTTLSSSADYSHSYVSQGILYCHLIDPRTGFPMNMPKDGKAQCGAATVTLTGDSAALNDALSTALCLMGPEKALSFLKEREEKMIMAVYRDDEETLEVVSNLPEDEVEILDPQYVWACREETDGMVYTGSYSGEREDP